MNKAYTCILCPQGCPLNVQYTVEESGGIKVISIDGTRCARGEHWVTEEVERPSRTITTSIRIQGGELPLLSVRTDSPIPKNRVFELMSIMRNIKVEAPVRRGQKIIEKVLGLDVNIIATRTVNRVG